MAGHDGGRDRVGHHPVEYVDRLDDESAALPAAEHVEPRRACRLQPSGVLHVQDGERTHDRRAAESRARVDRRKGRLRIVLAELDEAVVGIDIAVDEWRDVVREHVARRDDRRARRNLRLRLRFPHLSELRHARHVYRHDAADVAEFRARRRLSGVWKRRRDVRQPAARVSRRTNRQHADPRLPALLHDERPVDAAPVAAAACPGRDGPELALLRGGPDPAGAVSEELRYLEQRPVFDRDDGRP